MVKLRTYGQAAASLNGRSYYAAPRKRTRKARAPITAALKATLAKQREEHREEYRAALKNARGAIEQHATQLHESFGGHSTEYYIQEIFQRGRFERVRRKTSRWNAFVSQELRLWNKGMYASVHVPAPHNGRILALPPGQPKLKPVDLSGELSKKWGAMSDEMKVSLTDPLLEELEASREEADTKPKVIPIHVLNDVSSTMAKITREVRLWKQSYHTFHLTHFTQLDALHARTGFETIIFGTRSSTDHYTTPLVHATSAKIPKFFDLVIKKPVADLAMSIEAFCLSGVDGELS